MIGWTDDSLPVTGWSSGCSSLRRLNCHVLHSLHLDLSSFVRPYFLPMNNGDRSYDVCENTRLPSILNFGSLFLFTVMYVILCQMASVDNLGQAVLSVASSCWAGDPFNKISGSQFLKQTVIFMLFNGFFKCKNGSLW